MSKKLVKTPPIAKRRGKAKLYKPRQRLPRDPNEEIVNSIMGSNLTGGPKIATFDPLLGGKKLRDVVKKRRRPLL